MKKFKSLLVAAMVSTLTINCANDDATATATGCASVGTVSVADGGTVSGTQSQCVSVAADATVTFSGTVKFVSGTTLTVGSGATIKFDDSVLSYLIIAAGATIDAQGTSAKPIVMTSNKAAGARASQDWGGVVINGYADINSGDTATGEGNSGSFGGSDDTWNCGTLKYVRVEFAGKVFSGTDELNGIAFQGCGSGTTIQYVQVHKGSDDGIEFFGGKADASYIVLSNNADDNLDWTLGYRGTLSNVAISAAGSDTCIEADSNEDNNSATPLASVTIDKFTCIRNDGASGKRGVRIRRGTQFTLTNGYINGGGGEIADKCITGENAASSVSANNTNVIEECGATGHANTDAGTYTVNATVTNAPGTPLLAKASFASDASLSAAGSAAFKASATGTNVGVTTGAASNTDTWLDNWTSFPAN